MEDDKAAMKMQKEQRKKDYRDRRSDQDDREVEHDNSKRIVKKNDGHGRNSNFYDDKDSLKGESIVLSEVS